MRFLFTLNPAYGHLLPMLPLMSAARSAGHEVIVATGSQFTDEVQRHGYPLWTVGPHQFAATDEPPAEPDPTLDEAAAMMARIVEVFVRPAVLRTRQLRPLVERWRPDVIVHEITEMAGTEIATQVGALEVVHGFGTHLPDTVEFAAAMWQAFSRLSGTPNRLPVLLDALYVDPVPPALQLPTEAPFRDVSLLRPAVGTSYPGDRLPVEPAELPFPRTVYLTLGTIFNAPEAMATAIDAVRDIDANVIITTGPGTDPGRFGPLPAHLVITDFVPQALIMDRVHAVVSHVGSGTMLGALAAGVPQVGLPMGADQFANAEQLARTGAGVVVPVEERTPAAIRAALDAVLTDPAYARAARAVQAGIAAMPTAEDVLADIVDRAYLHAA